MKRGEAERAGTAQPGEGKVRGHLIPGYGHLMEGVKMVVSSQWWPVAGPETMGATGMHEVLSNIGRKIFLLQGWSNSGPGFPRK